MPVTRCDQMPLLLLGTVAVDDGLDAVAVAATAAALLDQHRLGRPLLAPTPQEAASSTGSVHLDIMWIELVKTYPFSWCISPLPLSRIISRTMHITLSFLVRYDESKS